jgi:hypothetical protein
MAQKKAEVAESTIILEQIKPKTLIVTVNGTSDLILCKKSRSYELAEIFKQSHPKGTQIPKKYQQDYCLWEKLITSIHWQKPIVFHDDDNSLYTEEEWNRYMLENKPCILANSWIGSFNEAFISCGFKDSTGKAGTDLKRTISFETLTPISFAKAGYDQHLAQTSGLSRTNVLTQQNVFSGWTADVEIHYLPIAFPKETVLGIMQCAGSFIGIGARRKEGYGRYELAEVKEIG